MIGMTLSLLATNCGVFTFSTIPRNSVSNSFQSPLEHGTFCGVTTLAVPHDHHRDASAELPVSNTLREDFPYRKSMYAVPTAHVVNRADFRILAPVVAYPRSQRCQLPSRRGDNDNFEASEAVFRGQPQKLVLRNRLPGPTDSLS